MPIRARQPVRGLARRGGGRRSAATCHRPGARGVRRGHPRGVRGGRRPARGCARRASTWSAARDRLLGGDPTAFPAIADELDLRLRTDRLVPLSRWVTPPTMPRRFDARFFAALAPDGVEATLVGDEVVAHAWHRPAAALDAMAAGELGMWLPTSTTLQQLEHATSIETIRDAAWPRVGSARSRSRSSPRASSGSGCRPAAASPGSRSTPTSSGGSGSCWSIRATRPVPGSTGRSTRRRTRGGRIVAVALTHVDPDHAGGAEALREQLGVEVLVGPGGGRYLPYPVVELGDGRHRCGDVAMRVVATPGLRAGSPGLRRRGGAVRRHGRPRRSPWRAVDPRTHRRASWRRSVERLRAVAPDARWLGGHPR